MYAGETQDFRTYGEERRLWNQIKLIYYPCDLKNLLNPVRFCFPIYIYIYIWDNNNNTYLSSCFED